MKRMLSLPLFLLLLGCPKPEPPGPPPNPGFDCLAQPTLKGLVPVANAIAGKYIVVLKRTNTIQPLAHATAQAGVTSVKTLRRGYAAQIAAQALAKILEDPNVEYVQADGIKSVNPLPAEATQSWGLDRVDQRDMPLDGQYTPGADGAGVHVAVVDTGITSHPDFADRLSAACFSAHGACTDGHGHGTHVAGTVGGTTWGVAKKANLYAVRVLDSNGSGSDSDVIAGLEWVTNKKLAAGANEDWVINMSLGGAPAPALDRATCDAIQAGVTVVVAAGNESRDANSSSPARVKQAVTVGASDRGDRQASFSNFGVLLDLYAPGVDITSTQPNGGTATFSGTSMASPHTAGAAALYLQRKPGSLPENVEAGLVAAASVDKLGWISAGSPNRLLFVREE